MNPTIVDSDIPNENTVNKVFKVRMDLPKKVEYNLGRIYTRIFESILELSCAVRLEGRRVRTTGLNSKTFERKLKDFEKLVALELDPESTSQPETQLDIERSINDRTWEEEFRRDISNLRRKDKLSNRPFSPK